MRKFVITMVTVFAVLAVGLICLMAIAIHNGGIRMERSEQSNKGFLSMGLMNTQNISLNGIDELTLSYHWDDVTFFTSDTEELILKEYMNFTPDADDLTQITKSGSRLRLERRRININNWFFGINHDSKVEIYLPPGYSGKLSASTTSGNIKSDIIFNVNRFQVSSSSGDLGIREVNAETISASTTSGNITINKAGGTRSASSSSGDIKILDGAGDTKASSTSGNVTIENSSGALKASASSGDITIKNSFGEKEIETTSGKIVISDSGGYTRASSFSGDIRLSEFDGAGDFDATSGNISLQYAEGAASINDDINIDTSSGDVTLALPSGLPFDFKARTSSGDIKTSFDDQLDFNKEEDYATGTVGDNPVFVLDISTTSGNIHVNVNNR